MVFMATAMVLGLWEVLSPRRTQDPDRKIRWTENLGVVFLSSLTLRVLFPILPALLAATVQARGVGLLPLLHISWGLQVILGVVLLDAAMYFQHRAFHKWAFLWRLHRMHHTDTSLDFTTGVRFHPLEIFLSLIFKLTVVVFIAPPPEAVLAFEIILNSAAMFNHANIFLLFPVDRLLRLFLVTPDMHRVHHSTDRVEMNRNFGFSFPWWDWIFTTYKDQPEEGHESMNIGLNIFRERKYNSIFWLLAIPFVNPIKTLQ